MSLDPEEAGPDAGAGIIRPVVKSAGGHATLVVASEAIRASVPVFEPLSAGLAQLTARVKNGFDPRGVLNPGRMQEASLMQTNFSVAQLADPDTNVSEKILRACVHCGFCTATCPTYVLLGDELDSPRGRIYLIKDMLENDRPATPEVVKHIDRCLSCLSCMTTCPSGVNYMHLVDHGRRHIEKTYKRPWFDQAVAARLRDRAAEPKSVSRVDVGGAPGRAFRRAYAGAAEGRARARSLKTAERFACRPAAGVQERGAAYPSRRALERLRPTGSRAADQRGDDPALDPPWLRSCRRRGRGMLRRAHPSSRTGRAPVCARQHSGLDERDRQWRT